MQNNIAETLTALESAIKMGHKAIIVALCEELDNMELSEIEQTKYDKLFKTI